MQVGSKFSFIFEKMPDFHRAKNEQYVLKDHDFRLAKITVNIDQLLFWWVHAENEYPFLLEATVSKAHFTQMLEYNSFMIHIFPTHEKVRAHIYQTT